MKEVILCDGIIRQVTRKRKIDLDNGEKGLRVELADEPNAVNDLAKFLFMTFKQYEVARSEVKDHRKK